MKMHEDEPDVDEGLVARLIASQCPRWRELPIQAVDAPGATNVMYRLGPDMVVRLPRVSWAVPGVEKEQTWLPRLAPGLPLPVPRPVAIGQPGEGFPWPWSIYSWIEGEVAAPDRLGDAVQSARALGGFLNVLHGLDPEGGPLATEHGLRAGPLDDRDERLRECVASLQDELDAPRVLEAWERALAAPIWSEPPVWVHGDVMMGNLLVHEGELSGVIDFGGLCVGDPACDLMIAWALFDGAGRAAFRESLALDDAAWERGRGHALAQALIFIPYYLDTNPAGVRHAWRVIENVLADQG